ncbi:hypothetical protein HZS_5091, partial [Henneguya salminicola]
MNLTNFWPSWKNGIQMASSSLKYKAQLKKTVNAA